MKNTNETLTQAERNLQNWIVAGFSLAPRELRKNQSFRTEVESQIKKVASKTNFTSYENFKVAYKQIIEVEANNLLGGVNLKDVEF